MVIIGWWWARVYSVHAVRVSRTRPLRLDLPVPALSESSALSRVSMRASLRSLGGILRPLRTSMVNSKSARSRGSVGRSVGRSIGRFVGSFTDLIYVMEVMDHSPPPLSRSHRRNKASGVVPYSAARSLNCILRAKASSIAYLMVVVGA